MMSLKQNYFKGFTEVLQKYANTRKPPPTKQKAPKEPGFLQGWGQNVGKGFQELGQGLHELATPAAPGVEKQFFNENLTSGLGRLAPTGLALGASGLLAHHLLKKDDRHQHPGY